MLVIYVFGCVLLCEIYIHTEALKSAHLRMIRLEQRIWPWMWRRTNMRGNNSHKLATMISAFIARSSFWKGKKWAADLDAQLQGELDTETLKTTRRLSAPFPSSFLYCN